MEFLFYQYNCHFLGFSKHSGCFFYSAFLLAVLMEGSLPAELLF